MLKKAILLVILGLSFTLSQADSRAIPSNVEYGIYFAGQYPEIELVPDVKMPRTKRILSFGTKYKHKTYQLSTAVRILDENNRFIVWGRLPQHKDKAIAVQYGNNDQINMIWILTDSEREQMKALAKAKAKESKDK